MILSLIGETQRLEAPAIRANCSSALPCSAETPFSGPLLLEGRVPAMVAPSSAVPRRRGTSRHRRACRTSCSSRMARACGRSATSASSVKSIRRALARTMVAWSSGAVTGAVLRPVRLRSRSVSAAGSSCPSERFPAPATTRTSGGFSSSARMAVRLFPPSPSRLTGFSVSVKVLNSPTQPWAEEPPRRGQCR
jgi:hypothetical protein